jgi:hypothetical protein
MLSFLLHVLINVDFPYHSIRFFTEGLAPEFPGPETCTEFGSTGRNNDRLSIIVGWIPSLIKKIQTRVAIISFLTSQMQ